MYGVSFDPSGRYLASGSRDQTVRVWDLRTGETKKTLKGHGALVWGVAYSRDGKYILASTWQGALRLWRVASSAASRVQHGHESAVYGVAFSADGRTLASGGMDHTLRLWDVTSGLQKKTLRGHGARLSGVNFSPVGNLVASGSYDRTIRLWYLASGAESRVLGGAKSAVNAVRFSPDGRLLASCSQGKQVRMWDLERKILKWEKEGHDHVLPKLAFSPDGSRLATASHDRTLKVWDSASGEMLQTLTGHTAPVWGVDYSPKENKLVSGSADGTVRLWDLSNGTNLVLEKKPGRAYAVAFHPGGKIIAAARSDGTASLIDISNPQTTVRSLWGHRAEVNNVAFSRDGKLVATSSDDGTIRLWDVSTGRPRWRAPVMLKEPPRIFTHTGWLHLDRPDADGVPPKSRWRHSVEKLASSASQSSDGKTLCVGTHAGRLEMWDLNADKRILDEPIKGIRQVLALSNTCLVQTRADARLVFEKGMSRSIAVSPTALALDSGRLLVATGQQVKVMDLQGKERASYQTGVGVMAMARIGKWLVVGFEDGNIELVPTNKGQKKPSFSFEGTPSSPVVKLLPGPPGTVVAGYASGFVGIWYLASGTKLDHSKLHGPVVHLMLKKDRLYAATELGDHVTMDLSTFYEDYCKLVRQVWKDVPVVWKKGLPQLKEPDRDHECFRKAVAKKAAAKKAAAKK